MLVACTIVVPPSYNEFELENCDVVLIACRVCGVEKTEV